MPLDEVDGAGLDAILATEARGVVLDFWGTWCQPCRTLRPHLEQLADQLADRWRLVAVHVEANEDLVERYEVTTTPTLVMLHGGREVGRVTGAATPSAIRAALAEASAV